MSYRLLITQMFSEPGNPATALSTVVEKFKTLESAETSYALLSKLGPKSAIYTSVARMYPDPGSSFKVEVKETD